MPGEGQGEREHWQSSGLASASERPARPGCGLQRPQRTRAVGVAISVGQIACPRLLDEHATPGQQLHQPADDLVPQRLLRVLGHLSASDTKTLRAVITDVIG